MLKNILFQAHWIVGITAGIVLALVGVTGAMLTFEDQIVHRLNTHVREVTPTSESPLSPPVLLERIRSSHPEKQITSLVISSDPSMAARVTFANPSAENAQGGRARGETRYLHPYTAEVFADEGKRGEGFFRVTMQLHRWLMAGDFGDRQVGRHIVGASTLLLVLMAISGLYLRWPRGNHSWRSWLALDFSLKGRSLLWNLHAVLGTWVLLAYLIMALTGLQWSYQWYRNGLYAIAGVERPAGGPRGAGRNDASLNRTDDRLDLTPAWQAFLHASGGAFSTATINLPRQPGAPVEIRYLDADPPHDRAYNTLALNTDGTVQRHELYAEKTFGAKLVASIFPLHSGYFFGLPGAILFLIASLAMPVFTITGWMLYLNRRERKARARARAGFSSEVPSTVPTARSGSG